MLGELAIQDWELVVRSDLAPHLVPPGQPPCVQRPAAVNMIPGGGHEALTRCVGRCELEDMLLVSASVRPAGPWWRRRCLYAPRRDGRHRHSESAPPAVARFLPVGGDLVGGYRLGIPEGLVPSAAHEHADGVGAAVLDFRS